uniref:Uncharacterized protein n=1 Tax=Sphaerodactylus townsendi TaxID=933632 RepID=A0ACB8FK44_9SAUR
MKRALFGAAIVLGEGSVASKGEIEAFWEFADRDIRQISARGRHKEWRRVLLLSLQPQNKVTVVSLDSPSPGGCGSSRQCKPRWLWFLWTVQAQEMAAGRNKNTFGRNGRLGDTFCRSDWATCLT